MVVGYAGITNRQETDTMKLEAHIILFAEDKSGITVYYAVDEQTTRPYWTPFTAKAKRFSSTEKALLALSDATSTPVLRADIEPDSAALYRVECTATPLTDAELQAARKGIGR